MRTETKHESKRYKYFKEKYVHAAEVRKTNNTLGVIGVDVRCETRSTL
jgi:hypothetical protein